MRGALDCLLQTALIKVMAVYLTSARISRALCGGKNILPRPFVRSFGGGACEGIGKVHRAISLGEVAVMQQLDVLELLSERLYKTLRKHSHAVFITFASMHRDLVAGKVEVFDA